MRSRNIKPGFFQNDLLGQCSPHARLLFIGLWCISDYRGNLEYRPMKIKGLLFPYEQVDVSTLIEELEGHGFVLVRNVDGTSYVHIPNFTEHQSPHKNEKSRGTKIPDIAGSCPDTVRVRNRDGIDTESVMLIPDSGYLIPDTGNLIPVDSSQQAVSPTAAPVLLFPLKNGEGWELCDELREALVRSHPRLDIDQELQRAYAWLIANPSRRKTAGGMSRFLNGWMSRQKPETLSGDDHTEQLLKDMGLTS